MQIPDIRPGEEFCQTIMDGDGTEKIRYVFCSLRGELFCCKARTKEEAQKRCEDWLFRQECRGCR